ncbi:hypothetical protein Calag_1308 [Caldisphaera lagunensis DSM 15908]|uniref:Uncharacterized protein n=1 Tax=Caldisphaera lagunensis (strain DSM 15908 / JCM 11604 / ANMR 0165 / IC-154) TaxID=1056495 RepID=L0AD91_CALLD|nr:hypothetical protein [Caldisphaera lagunensis]AFZ71020.1 hypothetical protein Calag_1308 [Caldisphaera lagunensis DSM 15908]
MSISEQYYNYIWECVRNGLKNDGIISLKHYNRLLDNFFKNYKGFFDIPLYLRFYLIVQAFIYTTLDQIIDILMEEDDLKSLEGYFKELLKLLNELRRDIMQEAKEYNVYDKNYEKTLILVDILKSFVERLIK